MALKCAVYMASTSHELTRWYRGLMRMENRFPEKADLFKDYFLLLIFTGLRRNEAMSL